VVLYSGAPGITTDLATAVGRPIKYSGNVLSIAPIFAPAPFSSASHFPFRGNPLNSAALLARARAQQDNWTGDNYDCNRSTGENFATGSDARAIEKIARKE